MFEQISMYSRIIVDSLFDTKHFMLLMVIVILTFTNALNILDTIQKRMF